MATSRKKTSSTTRSTKSVYFYPDQDAALLQAIAEAVDSGQVANFSELCKQALLQMLLMDQDPPVWDPPEPSDPLDSLDSVDHRSLWQSLQDQITQLEARIPHHRDPDERDKKRLHKLEQDLKALSQRVDDLMDNLARIQPAEPQPAPTPKRMPPQDPLLQRLAPLLEEF